MDKIKAFFNRLKFWDRSGKKEKSTSNTLDEKAEDGKLKLKKRTRYILVILIWIFVLAPWVVFYASLQSAKSEGLPSTKQLENPKSLEASEVYSSDGVLLGKYYSENRTPVSYAEISEYVVDALISTEDERYYEHAGVDIWSLPRVATGVISGDQSSGGGSTISQQLAKMLFSDRDFSEMGKFEKLQALISVKLREWMMAVELERKFTKKEIITMYLNKFDFLYNAKGIGTAARVYYNCTPDSLKMEEAAMLVGMCKNPSKFNPLHHVLRSDEFYRGSIADDKYNGDFEKVTQSEINEERAADSIEAVTRRNVVLKQWLKNSKEDNPVLENKITQKQYDSLKNIPIRTDYQVVDHQSGMAPYFREIVRESVVDTLTNMYMRDLVMMVRKKGIDMDSKYIVQSFDQMSKVLSESEFKDFKDSLKVILNKNNRNEAYEPIRMLVYRWAKYMIYNKGLKIYTTIDSRMQKYAEWSVKEYLSTTLQDKFEERIKANVKADEYPFDLRRDYYRKEDRDSVINYLIDLGVRRSDRWKRMKAEGISVEKRYHIFNNPIPMKVFSWDGEIDTVMSPRDSVRYYKQFLQAGMMAMDPKSGFVKAWVGGTDFYHFKFDHVIKSRRQVGSTFKPFVYATALDMGKITPCREIPNVEYCVDIPHNRFRNKEWCPGGTEYDGVMTSMKYCLAASQNNCTAWVMNEVKPINVVKRAIDMGINPNYLDTVPALALGIADLTVYEMVGAQATWVNKGLYTKPIIISRIEDKLGNVIYDADPYMKEVFDEQTAYLTLQLMKGVTDGARRSDGKSMGTAAGIRYDSRQRDWDGIRAPMAGKTGTTQNGSDGWFIGLTPDLVTGVWVGAEDRAVHFPYLTWGQGGRMALPIYGYFMNKVYADKDLDISQEDFEKPSQHIPEELWNCTLSEDNEDPTYDDYIGDDPPDDEPWF